MHPARWLVVVGFALVAVLPCGGQDAKTPLRYNELLYPIGPGYRWHYRVTDQKAPKSPETDAKTAKKHQTVLVTVEREQTFSLKIKNDPEGKSRAVVGYELAVHNPQPSGEKKTMLEQVLI